MSAPVLLAFDYPGRRSEARVSDLRLAEAGYDVRQLMTQPLPRAASAAEYVQQTLDSAGAFPSGVHAVLAYCMAAPFAQEAAARTGCSRLLLFDGEPATPQAIDTEYRKLLASVGGRSMLPSWWGTEVLQERSDRFLIYAKDHLTDIIGRSLAEEEDLDEEDEETIAPLVDSFLDWLAYLLAAHRTDNPFWDGTVVNFLSQKQPEISVWPGARGVRSVRIDTARDGLLTSTDTRRRLLETLDIPRESRYGAR